MTLKLKCDYPRAIYAKGIYIGDLAYDKALRLRRPKSGRLRSGRRRAHFIVIPFAPTHPNRRRIPFFDQELWIVVAAARSANCQLLPHGKGYVILLSSYFNLAPYKTPK
jgi:hypothetical protein